MALFNYECDEVKRKIQEVSPNYPQLTTYEKEWLYFHKYGYIPGVPVELEYETVSVNPTGSVSNAIPFQYKSAILKGNTLVNYAQITSHNFDENRTPIQNLNKPLEKGKTYTIILNIVSQTVTIGITTRFSKNNTEYIGIRTFNGVGLHKYLFTATTDFNQFAPYVDIGEYQSGLSAEYNQLMILEGDYTSVDIPFFEGMPSVKMPVLTTTNGEPEFIEVDGEQVPNEAFKSNILTVNGDVELRKVGNVQDELNLLTGELTQRIGEIVLDGSENWLSLGEGNYTFLSMLTDIKKPTFKEINILSGDYPVVSYFDAYYGAIGISLFPDAKYDFWIRTNIDSNNAILFKEWLSQNPIKIYYQLLNESVKTVALTPLNNPYEGTNHYELTSNIPCEVILDVPVVSTGKQTLEEINN